MLRTNLTNLHFTKSYFTKLAACVAVLSCFAVTAQAQQQVKVTIKNLSETGGVFLTPLWFGFHDGSFDSYNPGSAASTGLERIAEDGNFMPLSGEFSTATSGNGQDGVVTGPSGFGSTTPQPPLIDTGETASALFTVDSSNRYFSYVSMVIPSNDAFIANGSPTAHQAFDAAGNFTPIEFLVLGSEVLDAGTEDNTEMNAAFLDQSMADTGDTTSGGTVGLHPGFIGSAGNSGGTSIILGGTNGAGISFDQMAADFTRQGFQVARIRVSAVPEPSTLLLAGLGLVSMGMTRRKRG